MKVALIALLNGLLFGSGLALSGMTDRTKVIGFLDIAGNWDISLIFVMGGGLLITFPTFQWLHKKFASPLCHDCFNLPAKTQLDKKLIIGAILFGMGWGLYGFCPGPAIASLAYFSNPALSGGLFDSALFVSFMIIGMLATAKIQK